MSDKPKVVAKITNKYGDPEGFAERELKAVADIQNERIGTELIRLSDHEAQVAGFQVRLAQALGANKALAEALGCIHNWLVCAPIASADDMAQSFADMEAAARNALTVYGRTEP